MIIGGYVKIRVYRVLEIVCLLLLIVSSFFIYKWYRENQKTKSIVTTINKYLIIDEGYKVDPKIEKVNPDTIGWIKVDNTKINYPIVKGNDNKYYLNHNLYKEKSSAGWIFMDSFNNLDDQNIVIYGHHRRDGSMFGSIDRIFNNPQDRKILLVINDDARYYQIFSVYKTTDNDFYIKKNFNNFNKVIQEFNNRSNYNYQKKLNGIEQIITLSTCSNDNKDRLVVQGYRIDN